MSASLIRAKVAGIIVRDRLRKVLPDRVETLLADYRERGLLQPVDLVETDEGMRLRFGAHRLAAVTAAGDVEIDALLHPKGTFGGEAEIRAAEIAENLVRFELSTLERAVSIAEWRAAHIAQHPPKPGPKSKLRGDAALEELGAQYALNFSEVVQRTIGLSRRAVFLALKIATIDAGVRDSIAAHPVAGSRTDLLALAAQPIPRQVAIASLLASGVASVEEAIAKIEQLPPALTPAAYERVSDRFSRLNETDQHRFFSLHAEAITLWLAKRPN